MHCQAIGFLEISNQSQPHFALAPTKSLFPFLLFQAAWGIIGESVFVFLTSAAIGRANVSENLVT